MCEQINELCLLLAVDNFDGFNQLLGHLKHHLEYKIIITRTLGWILFWCNRGNLLEKSKKYLEVLINCGANIYDTEYENIPNIEWVISEELKLHLIELFTASSKSS
jgi:hypothetical protein